MAAKPRPRKVRRVSDGASARRIASTCALGGGKPAPGIDEEMRAPPLLRVGHLAGEQRRELPSVMPGRASTRARWISASAVTTTIDVDAPRRVRSRRAAARRAARAGVPAALRRPGTPPRSRAPADGRSPRAAPAPRDRRDALGEPRAVDRAVDGHARETPPRSAATAAPAIEAVHGRVGIVDRNAARARTSPPSCSCPCRSSR